MANRRRDGYWAYWIPKLVGVSCVCLLVLGVFIWAALRLFPHNPPEPPPYTQNPLPSSDGAASMTVQLVAAYHGSGGEAVEPTSAGPGITYALYLLSVSAKQNMTMKIQVAVEGSFDRIREVKGPIDGPVPLDIPPLSGSWNLDMGGNALGKEFDLSTAVTIPKGSTATYGLVVRSDVPKLITSVSVEVDLTTTPDEPHKLAASGPGLYILPLSSSA